MLPGRDAGSPKPKARKKRPPPPPARKRTDGPPSVQEVQRKARKAKPKPYTPPGGDRRNPDNRAPRAEDPVKVRGRRGGNPKAPVVTRTFRNVDAYKAYETRKATKRAKRAELRKSAREAAKVDARELTPAARARADERYEAARREHAKDPASGKPSRKGFRGAEADKPGASRPGTRRARKRLEDRYVREGERQIEAENREQHREHREQIARGEAPSGTSAEKGVTAGIKKRAKQREQAVLKKAKAKRRGGGVKQLLTNAVDEVKDTVTGAPASAQMAAEVVAENAKGLAEAVTNPEKSKRKGDNPAPKTAAVVKAAAESSPAVALAQGDVKEALGRAKERPLSALSEAAVVVAPAARAPGALRAAATAGKRGTSAKKAVKARKPAREARPDLKVQETPAKRAKGKTARKAVRQRAAAERKAHREQTRAQAEGRDQAPKERSGTRSQPRRYSANAGVRAAQKATDRARAHAGSDPNVATKRQARRARKRLADADRRNVQAGGIGREEAAAKTVRKATKRMSEHEKAAVELLTNARVRPNSIDEDLAAVRAVIAENDSPFREQNLKLLDGLKDNPEILRSPKVQAAARAIAEDSRTGDVRQARGGYGEQDALEFVRRLQGPLGRGEVAPRSARANVGGEGRTASAPASRFDTGQPVPGRGDIVATVAPRGVTVGERAGAGPNPGEQAPRAIAPERAGERGRAEAELRSLQARFTQLRRFIRENPQHARRSQAATEMQRTGRRIEDLEVEIERLGPKTNAPAHEATIGGDVRPEDLVNQQPGQLKAGQIPEDVAPKSARRARPASRVPESNRPPRRSAAASPPGNDGTGATSARRDPGRAMNPGERAASDPSSRPKVEREKVEPSADVVREAEQHLDEGGYQFESGPYKGQRVTLDKLRTLTSRDDAGFLRGRERDSDPLDADFGGPEAGHGYQIDDLLGPLGKDRLRDNALEREQRLTLRNIETQILDRHAARSDQGAVLAYRDADQAAKAAREYGQARGEPYGILTRSTRTGGTEYVLAPKYLADRLRKQMADDGRVMRGAKWATRLAIRATLPFSITWHAGNTVDLMVRLATTLDPLDAKGASGARHALERQLDQISPDLRHEVLDSLVGHFGSRQTVRDPRLADVLRGTRLENQGRVLNELGDYVKKGPGRIVDKAFDISSDLEKIAVNQAVGSQAKAYARELGIQIKDHDTAMRELAEHLEADPMKVHELQNRVLEIVGDFATRTPTDRVVMAGIDPFWRWMKASSKFVLRTLPSRHPRRTALMFIAANLTAEERAKAGLNYYWNDAELDKLRADLDYPDRRDGFMLGALGDASDAMPVGGLTSFGEVARVMDDPASLAGRPLSYLTRPATAAAGYYRSPGEVGIRALPGGGEKDDLKIKDGDPQTRAAALAIEAAIPGVKQVRIGREGGAQPAPDSTFWDPHTYGDGNTRGAVDRLLNPAAGQPVRGRQVTGAQILDRTPATSKGQYFEVELEDGTIVRLRRTR